MQYSKCGLTNDLYSLKIISFLLLVIAANNNSQIFFFHYFFQLFSFHEIFFFQIIHPNMNFSVLNFICHLSDQLTNTCRSALHLFTLSPVPAYQYILVSFANLRISLDIPSSIPIIQIMKSNGPSIEPWGTPLSTSVHCDAWPFITTLCLLPFSHSSIQLNNFPFIPRFPLTFQLVSCGTLSKAFLKSKYNGTTAKAGIYLAQV